MPDKAMRMARSRVPGDSGHRPVTLAIAGDSASGKTTLARGIVAALGPDQCTSICVDDYHRYDRAERARLPLTPLDPACNYVDIMEQHLQMLATGQPVLKPVYDHRTGTLGRPEYVEPRPYLIVEGLLPLVTRLSRACFDVSVFLDPPEEQRRAWKVARDCEHRGYTEAEVLAELAKREPDSERHIRPQRRNADLVVRFEPEPEGTMSARLLLRPTIPHPSLRDILTDDVRTAINLAIMRDADGTPVDCLTVDGHAAPEEIRLLQKVIWHGVAHHRELPSGLGELPGGGRSEPLAVTQLLLLYHLTQEVYAG